MRQRVLIGILLAGNLSYMLLWRQAKGNADRAIHAAVEALDIATRANRNAERYRDLLASCEIAR